MFIDVVCTLIKQHWNNSDDFVLSFSLDSESIKDWVMLPSKNTIFFTKVSVRTVQNSIAV